MFVLMTVILLITAVAGIAYLVTRFHRFNIFQRLSGHGRFISWSAAAAPVVVINLLIGFMINVYSALVVTLHLIVIWMLCDLVALIIRKIRKKPFRYNYQGAAAMIVTVLYMCTGWYMAHHVFRTYYAVDADGRTGGENLRIVMIADSHIGITLDGDDFARQTERVQKERPDIVVITGDFVDDDTEASDMTAACAALGRLETTYGVYFVYGNHDNGYFGYRDFTSDRLRDELEKNGVVILEDEICDIGEHYCLIGRKDRSFSDRADMSELMSRADSSKYTIVLDHQPNDYDNEQASGADMVLSGHTHGGHIFPVGLIGLAIGANDKVYGHEKRADTDFIVTSGISGWAIPFKTGTASEYVVIDIA